MSAERKLQSLLLLAHVRTLPSDIRHLKAARRDFYGRWKCSHPFEVDDSAHSGSCASDQLLIFFKDAREGPTAEASALSNVYPLRLHTLLARIFPTSRFEKIRPGFRDALEAEVLKIIEKIPNEDLAIQWDCATEVQDAYGAIPGF